MVFKEMLELPKGLVMVVKVSFILNILNLFIRCCILSQNEIEWAKKVIATLKQIQEQGDKRGAFKVDGKMIDAVNFKQAKLILDRISKDI